MDEKELVKKIRNSFKSGSTEEEVTRTLQNQGYKLEYITILINKAKKGKRLFVVFGVLFIMFIVILILSGLIGYGLFLKAPSIENKANLTNPLAGFKVIFSEKPNPYNPSNDSSAEKEIYLEDIELTPDFITYLLTELGAWQLKANPMNSEVPSINFDIDQIHFNSVVRDNEVITTEEFSDNPDAVFHSNKEDIVRAVLSEDPSSLFKQSYNEGRSSLEVIKSEAELFTKGYLTLYNSLNN
ncbi:MAG: hypothetical protein KKF89_05795 [Nanoarchaeota archaeon]|nr:hypothetical protein [Nanoarchaeota archaeon]